MLLSTYESCSEIIKEFQWLHAAAPPGISADVGVGVLASPLLHLLFPHVGLEKPGSRGLRPAWNPECTNLLPALVMVSPAKPGTFLESNTGPAVSAQPGLGSLWWVSLAKSAAQHHSHL